MMEGYSRLFCLGNGRERIKDSLSEELLHQQVGRTCRLYTTFWSGFTCQVGMDAPLVDFLGWQNICSCGLQLVDVKSSDRTECSASVSDDSWSRHVRVGKRKGKSREFVHNGKQIAILAGRRKWSLEIYVQAIEDMRVLYQPTTVRTDVPWFQLCTIVTWVHHFLDVIYREGQISTADEVVEPHHSRMTQKIMHLC